MPVVRKRIGTYSIASLGKHDADYWLHITLRDSNGDVIAHLYYVPDTQALPDNRMGVNNDIFSMHKHLSQAAIDIDILRNESPVDAVYYSPTRAWITTAREPVGEDE